MRNENERLAKKKEKRKDITNTRTHTHTRVNLNEVTCTRSWKEVRTSLERKRKRESISTWNACKNYIAACIPEEVVYH